MPSAWIAETTWVAHDVAGGRESLITCIARPVPCGPDEWQCALSLHGPHASPAPAHGHDAPKALGLAWQFAGCLLREFVAGGARLEYEGAEPVDLTHASAMTR